MRDKVNKFVHPKRIAELDPVNTLRKAGFSKGMVLCDIGAGPGVFSLPAAEISDRDVYAIELSDEMIEILERKKSEGDIKNLQIRKSSTSGLPLDKETCDFALLITVLHELEDPNAILQEIKRALKDRGRLLIVEFYKEETPSSPPPHHKISEKEVDEYYRNNGFRLVEKFRMSDNLYAVIVEK